MFGGPPPSPCHLPPPPFCLLSIHIYLFESLQRSYSFLSWGLPVCWVFSLEQPIVPHPLFAWWIPITLPVSNPCLPSQGSLETSALGHFLHPLLLQITIPVTTKWVIIADLYRIFSYELWREDQTVFCWSLYF